MTNDVVVVVVADDLIWASRLAAAVERADSGALRVGTVDGLRRALERDASPDTKRVVGVLIDLNGRRFDGVEAVGAAAESGLPVVAVGQHEDIALRKRALAAGALRVFSYDKFFRDGPAVVAEWLAPASAR